MEKNETITLCPRLEGVLVFNKAFKHPVADEPVAIIDIDYIKKRIAYMQEEQKELLEAAERNDIVGCLDACLDIEYFNLGTVFGLGLGKVYQEGFNIVQASNMSKLLGTTEEVEATQKKAWDEDQIETYSAPSAIEGLYCVYNASTNKVVKPAQYVAPDLNVVFTESELKRIQ